MVAGLPGTGIGGCFFLLTALLMPVVELWRTVQGRSSLKQWGFVLQYCGMALGIMAAMWATGWLIGQALFAVVKASTSPAAAALEPRNFLGAPPVVFTLLTLTFVLLSVGGLRLAFAKKRVTTP